MRAEWTPALLCGRIQSVVLLRSRSTNQQIQQLPLLIPKPHLRDSTFHLTKSPTVQTPSALRIAVPERNNHNETSEQSIRAAAAATQQARAAFIRSRIIPFLPKQKGEKKNGTVIWRAFTSSVIIIIIIIILLIVSLCFSIKCAVFTQS